MIEVMPSAIDRAFLRYLGGKARLAQTIIRLMPSHAIYTESFGGGGSVLLQKGRAKTDVYNDICGDVVNAFRQMRDHGPALERLLKLTPFSREEYNAAYEPTEDPMEAARRFIFRSAAGIGSDSMRRRNGFRTGMNDEKMSTAGSWANMAETWPRVIDRLQGVLIENRPAEDVLRGFDSRHTLHYVDPPYLHSTRRRTRSRYSHEITDTDHEAIAECLHGLKGMVILSGYESELYRRLYRDWRTVELRARDNANAPRTEVLWFSPNCQEQGMELFTRI